MQNVYPTLRITDYETSRSFYVDKLGFWIDWEHRFEPHFPVFMQITREGLSLYLSQHQGDCQVGGLVYLYVPNVDSWYHEMTHKGVQIDAPPTDQPWGDRDIRVVDSDGNQLNICTRLNS
ncbi:VOC family protein [Kovacikia minuta CCNUW1]|uniref:glyoxalase superfamily protein n=1 Tax=Kovacikia minuta TaxID=2931930 RepID=UPI001CCFA8FD|nr:glyoxalase superfamily protein [Kovacikia minuta]UBF28890.1 VOC family protein [Kovacikia minuta CCNUW1]